jgi:hypothetical protein
MSDASSPIYVYGFTSVEQAPDPDFLGQGIGGVPASVITGTRIAALVTPASAEPVDPIRRNMLAHTKLLERAMCTATVLPMRFGAVAPSEAAVLRCMEKHVAALEGAMTSIVERVELGVKATWQDGVIYADIMAGDASLRSLRDRLQSRPASETYYERIELGREVERRLVARREAEAAEIVALLTPLADRVAELRTLEETMILNRAFLVSRANERQFDARMEDLKTRFDGRISFRYVGPVPPYNFVSLRTEWLAAA